MLRRLQTKLDGRITRPPVTLKGNAYLLFILAPCPYPETEDILQTKLDGRITRPPVTLKGNAYLLFILAPCPYPETEDILQTKLDGRITRPPVTLKGNAYLLFILAPCPYPETEDILQTKLDGRITRPPVTLKGNAYLLFILAPCPYPETEDIQHQTTTNPTPNSGPGNAPKTSDQARWKDYKAPCNSKGECLPAIYISTMSVSRDRRHVRMIETETDYLAIEMPKPRHNSYLKDKTGLDNWHSNSPETTQSK
eukprot:sb/3468657/